MFHSSASLFVCCHLKYNTTNKRPELTTNQLSKPMNQWPKTIRWCYFVLFRPDRGWVTVAGIRCSNSQYSWIFLHYWSELNSREFFLKSATEHILNMAALWHHQFETVPKMKRIHIFSLSQVNRAHLFFGNLSVGKDLSKSSNFCNMWRFFKFKISRYVASTILPNHSPQPLPEMPPPAVLGDKVQKIHVYKVDGGP